MRSLLGALTMILGLGIAPGSAQAQTSEDAIRAVISDQIAALRADDFETAFSFASPNIQGMFGDPERFGQMVRDGYPMVWRPADIRFSLLQERNGETVQSVVVTDEAGALHVLDYHMLEVEGGWQINGVTIRRPSDAGA